MKKPNLAHGAQKFGLIKKVLFGITLFLSGYVVITFAVNSGFVQERVTYIMNVIEDKERKYELTGDDRVEYYKTLRSIYQGVVNSINAKLGDNLEDIINESLSGGLSGGGTGTICPAYTAPPRPPQGCTYKINQDINGCVVGSNLECITSTGGVVNTGSSLYNRQARKVCEGKTIVNGTATQKFMWYDTDNKPTDSIATCSQPALPNGGLICTERIPNGCCPLGEVAINGTCITPANAGGNCFATSGCKTGLECSNNKCISKTTTGDSGTSNTGVATVVTCSAKPSYLTSTNATFVVGTPTGANQSWQNSSTSSACYYACKTGYSGMQCNKDSEGGITYSCSTKPSYLTSTNATFVVGTPTGANQSWQNSSTSSACYYACKTGYSGMQCSPIESTGEETGGNQGNLGCTRGGVSYIHGDVRCDANKQVRCNNGNFIQIYTCSSGELCTENLERTSGGNFYTSCIREYDTYKTDGSYNYITVSSVEKETFKENALYKCKYNTATRTYGNCTYQSCSSQSHEEAGSCISDVRDCTIPNTVNGGRQIWSAGSWGACQPTSSTQCITGYRMIDGSCKTGADTCNSPMIGAGGSSKNLLTANGVDVSNKTYGGYLGGGIWSYDYTLSEACTWKCEDGYKKTSEISGWRGSEFCIKKNICDDDEYFDTTWTSAEHANQACDTCKGTMPYIGSSNSTVFTSSTKRGSYINMIERASSENQTWKYIANGTIDALAESCTWSCKSGFIPGYVKAPMSARGPLTCCSPSDSTCIPANL